LWLGLSSLTIVDAGKVIVQNRGVDGLWYPAPGRVSAGRTANDAEGYYKDRMFADHTGARDLDVEYHVIPEPPSPIDEGIAELAKHVPMRLEALYEGEDPFTVAEDEPEAMGEHNGKRERRTSRRARVHS
jgi:hypothetical protein